MWKKLLGGKKLNATVHFYADGNEDRFRKCCLIGFMWSVCCDVTNEDCDNLNVKWECKEEHKAIVDINCNERMIRRLRRMSFVFAIEERAV